MSKLNRISDYLLLVVCLYLIIFLQPVQAECDIRCNLEKAYAESVFNNPRDRGLADWAGNHYRDEKGYCEVIGLEMSRLYPGGELLVVHLKTTNHMVYRVGKWCAAAQWGVYDCKEMERLIDLVLPYKTFLKLRTGK